MKSIALIVFCFLFAVGGQAQDQYFRFVSPDDKPTSNHWTFTKTIASMPVLKDQLKRNHETPAQVAANSALRSSVVAGKGKIGITKENDDIIYRVTEEVRGKKHRTLIFPISIVRGKQNLLKETPLVAQLRKGQTSAKEVKAITLQWQVKFAPQQKPKASAVPAKQPAVAKQAAPQTKPKAAPKKADAPSTAKSSTGLDLGAPGDGKAKVTPKEKTTIDKIIAAEKVEAAKPPTKGGVDDLGAVGTKTKGQTATPGTISPEMEKALAPKPSATAPKEPAKLPATEAPKSPETGGNPNVLPPAANASIDTKAVPERRVDWPKLMMVLAIAAGMTLLFVLMMSIVYPRTKRYFSNEAKQQRAEIAKQEAKLKECRRNINTYLNREITLQHEIAAFDNSPGNQGHKGALQEQKDSATASRMRLEQDLAAEQRVLQGMKKMHKDIVSPPRAALPV